jgi:hypothetical protein
MDSLAGVAIFLNGIVSDLNQNHAKLNSNAVISNFPRIRVELPRSAEGAVCPPAIVWPQASRHLTGKQTGLNDPARQARTIDMFGLFIRGAFWFSLVLILLPIFDQGASDRLQKEKGVELTDALGAAAGAISYMGSMCSEKPDVCIKGAETISTLGNRAKEGARVAYSYLDTQFADDAKTKAADKILTGSVQTADDLPRHIPIPVPRPKDI